MAAYWVLNQDHGKVRQGYHVPPTGLLGLLSEIGNVVGRFLRGS